MNRTARTAGPITLALTALGLAAGLFFAAAPGATAAPSAPAPSTTVFALAN